MRRIVVMGIMGWVLVSCGGGDNEERIWGRWLPEVGYAAPVYFQRGEEIMREVPDGMMTEIWSYEFYQGRMKEYRQWYSWDKRRHWFRGNMFEIGWIGWEDRSGQRCLGRYLGVNSSWEGCVILWVNRCYEVERSRDLREIYDEEIGEETEVVYSTIPEEAFREVFPEFGGEYHYIEPRAITLSVREWWKSADSEYRRVIGLRRSVLYMLEEGVELVGCEVRWGDDLVEVER